jgi:acetoin utilization protein AcuB
MATFPTTISPTETIAQARRKLSEHGIHHLPVMENGRLLGVVTDRDLELLASFLDHSAQNVKVAAVMTAPAFSVRRLAPVDEVVKEMVTRRYSSAIVMDGLEVVGVFTDRDGLRAFADFMSGRIPAALE